MILFEKKLATAFSVVPTQVRQNCEPLTTGRCTTIEPLVDGLIFTYVCKKSNDILIQ